LPSGDIRTNIEGELINSFLRSAPQSDMDNPRVWPFVSGDFSADLFVESIAPTLRLIIAGAGDDAIPLTRLARFMGYEVAIVDGRFHQARASRFPDADAVHLTTGADPLGGVTLDEWTAVVLMSHSYAQDLAALRAICGRNLPYVGILGPRRRAERMLAEVGIALDEIGAALHSPVGLDIGADGAEQIALAVIAELQSVLNRRAGGRLREKAGPLRPPATETVHSIPASCFIE
jgi:xanthine/CO dehydrogenase XdhC/CoxF family maturation factor